MRTQLELNIAYESQQTAEHEDASHKKQEYCFLLVRHP